MAKRARRDDIPVAPMETVKATPEELMAFQSGGGTLIGGSAGGFEFYTSSPNQNRNVKPLIDGEKVFETLGNELIERGITSHEMLIFTKKPVYHAYGEKGAENTELGITIEEDMEHKGLDRGLSASMKLSYRDIYGFGCYILQPSWLEGEDGVIRPKMLKRLPPESFFNPPRDTRGYVGDDILRGIGVRDGIYEFWQTQIDGSLKRLSNIVMMRDMSLPGICGQSRIKSLIPKISFYNLCSKAQAQKINRIGAPILFIQFTSAPVVIPGIRDDIDHARKIIQYWGKESQYILRENMKAVELNFNDNQSAIQTMERLEKEINDHFSPSASLQREGSNTGTDSGKIDLVKLFIQNAHEMLEDNWEQIVETYLDLNGYTESVEIELPEAEPDRADLDLRRAQAIDTMGIGTMDEKRVLAGLSEATPEILAEIQKERETRAKMIPGATLGQGQDPVKDGKMGGRPDEAGIPPNPNTKKKVN